METALWAITAASLAAVVYAQLGYGVLLALLSRWKRAAPMPVPAEEPPVALVIAAHREEGVIAAKVENARQLHYPQVEVIVACDGSPDATPERAREAGADRVLDLPWGGKVKAQDAAVAEVDTEIVAFSDANAMWAPDALSELVAAFADPAVAYACGRVTFENAAGDNQEGVYWRYEMWLRAQESRLHSVTAGNGAIYAVRRADYLAAAATTGHDLSLPFRMVKRGRRAVDVPTARATEKMVPTLEGEFARKRRMMSHSWKTVLRTGMLDPRGYGPLYLMMIVSHRILRYATPLLHLVALAGTAALVAVTTSPVAIALLALQLALPLAALAARRIRFRPFLLARYYVDMTSTIALGLYDHLRRGTPAGWAPPEGTR